MINISFTTKIKIFILRCIKWIISPLFFSIMLLVWISIFLKRKRIKKTAKPRLIWGRHPLQSNQYWSNSLKLQGYDSLTLMKWAQLYQNRSTYDMFSDEVPITSIKLIDKYLRHFFDSYISFTYAINNFDIFHHHFYGGFLEDTILKKYEAQLLKWFGCKTVITAVGGDFYRYNSIINASLHVGFLMCYPAQVHEDKIKQAKIDYWTKHADFIMVGFQIDRIGRWDMMPFNMVCIQTKKFLPKSDYSIADGINSEVKIIHAPNHRGLKGTEFITKAIEDLKTEGLKIQFQLIENLQNDDLLKLMGSADILVDQLLFGYGLNAIEGMASGLCVISNLENEEYTRPFRRFSYLNECSVVSATPESIKENLRTLIKNPQLRKELGTANRKYAEKYHSEATTKFIFENIYKNIWHGDKSVDLMQIFHPLNTSSYNNMSAVINHPLVENRLLQ